MSRTTGCASVRPWAMVLTVLCLLGCGDDAAALRETQLAGLEASVLELPTTALVGSAPEGIEPPTGVEGDEVLVFAPRVEVRLDGALVLDGRRMSDGAQLTRDLDVLRRNWAIIDPRHPVLSTINVWADRRLTMGQLDRALEAAHGYGLVLLVEDAAHAAPQVPCPQTFASDCPALERAAGSERADLLAPMWRRAIGDCPSLQALSESIASVDALERGRSMREGIVSAARQCAGGDGVDLLALRYLVVAVLGGAPIRGAPLPPLGGVDRTMTVGEWVAQAR